MFNWERGAGVPVDDYDDTTKSSVRQYEILPRLVSTSSVVTASNTRVSYKWRFSL